MTHIQSIYPIILESGVYQINNGTGNPLSVVFLLAFWILCLIGIIALIRTITKNLKQRKENEMQLLREQNALLKQIANNKGE